ncbi:hypothetical protein Goshw_015778 [Gossypium schwendimanii]|uniref:RNase H type-1 domain-containing protein n=1 Tax=Gossypium schwendimanii TaxID=34291 RepID=A0A7J9MVH1_GOSSC|nr:hypothetical protein [Gossypium schwendimanii]
MIWSIRDGQSIRCWEDNSVPDVGPFIKYISSHINISTEQKVHEIVLRNGAWNLDLFRVWLPEEVVQCIISVPSPLELASPDTLSWSRTTNGGVIHDEKGTWILGYNRFLGKCSVAVAELWGILDGFVLLQKQGYDEVIIQSDNFKNVISISDKKNTRPKNNLIRRI